MFLFKKYQSFILIALLIIVAWLALTSRQSKSSVDLGNDPIFFYSLTCPHCKNVEEYIAKNNIRKKVKFQELEVSQNADSAVKFNEAAKICDLNPLKVGVPMLYDKGKCYEGKEEVIIQLELLSK